MATIQTATFNKGKLKVWFYIDNIRYYDKDQNLKDDDNKFICYFKFSEPSALCLGEQIKNPQNQTVYHNSINNAYNNGLNYVKTKFKLQD